MKIVVWGINYAPELTGIAPYNKLLCDYLKARGDSLEMVTSFPYYPAWKKRAEDRGKYYQTEMIDGVPVHRCWHYVPAKVKAWKRILHEASFVATSFLKVLTLPRADVMVVVSPPLLLGAAAWLMGLIKRAPFVFHVQDLQPDAAVGLGMLKPGLLTRMLYRLERLAYKEAARVSGISPGMLEAYRSKGVPEKKIVYFPNPVPLPEPAAFPARGGFRQAHGISAETFLAVYSGNLGVKQGTDILVDAARLLPKGIQLVICGDGARREHLQNLLKAEGLKNVLMLPLLDTKEYHQMLVDADVCLITQQRGSGKAFFPSKLLTTLAFGRPVIAVADEDGELYRAVELGRFGEKVSPEDAHSLASALQNLQSNPDRLKECGRAGRRYVEQFEEERVLAYFAFELEKVAGVGSEIHRERKVPVAPAL